MSVLPPSAPIVDVRVLMKGQTTALILLDEQIYTLRITKTGKLILTK